MSTLPETTIETTEITEIEETEEETLTLEEEDKGISYLKTLVCCHNIMNALTPFLISPIASFGDFGIYPHLNISSANLGVSNFSPVLNVGSANLGVSNLSPNLNIGSQYQGPAFANFGYEEIGPNPHDMESGGVGYIKGSIFTCPNNGTAQSITVALKRYVAGSDKFRCAIYKHSDLTLIGNTEERTLSLTTSFAWYTFNFNDPKPNLTVNEVYILVVWAKYTTQYLYIAGNNAGGTNQQHYKATAWNNWPNPWVSPYHFSYKDSIYCHYAIT
jgi:hypothetical protein